MLTEAGPTAWFVEVWDDIDEDARNVRVRQRTTVVICRPDRMPPCIRVEPADVNDVGFFRRWIDSERAGEPDLEDDDGRE